MTDSSYLRTAARKAGVYVAPTGGECGMPDCTNQCSYRTDVVCPDCAEFLRKPYPRPQDVLTGGHVGTDWRMVALVGVAALFVLAVIVADLVIG